jgi:molybdopterin synthase sulfur carrier subunit
MPSVRFTRNIQRHVECPTLDVPGATLGEVLNAYFATNERARGYVLEDDGRLRKHMAVFIDGQQIEDREKLSDTLSPRAVVDVVQSLSGG